MRNIILDKESVFIFTWSKTFFQDFVHIFNADLYKIKIFKESFSQKKSIFTCLK